MLSDIFSNWRNLLWQNSSIEVDFHDILSKYDFDFDFDFLYYSCDFEFVKLNGQLNGHAKIDANDGSFFCKHSVYYVWSIAVAAENWQFVMLY